MEKFLFVEIGLNGDIFVCVDCTKWRHFFVKSKYLDQFHNDLPRKRLCALCMMYQRKKKF